SADRPLPLGVLGCLAGALETVLLALLHPRVAGEEAGLAERQAVRGLVDLEQGPGDAVADRAGLARHATALDLDHRVVVALGAGHPEGHPDVRLVHRVAEVLLERSPVDDDLALPGEQANTGDGRLATTGPGEEGRSCTHRFVPRQASGSGRWA